jgi:hypothetical protein
MSLRMLRFTALAFVWPLCTAVAQQPAAPPSVPASGPRISGYLQARETYQSRIGLTSSINRARVTVAGGIATGFTWRVQGEFRTGSVGTGKASVSLQDAYIRYARNRSGVQVGQFKTPFTLEFVTSLADLETADRSTVVDSLAPKRDIGVMGDYALGKRLAVYGGVFNGDGQNVTVNKDSTVLGVARAVVTLVKGLSVGGDVARYFGDSTRYGGEAAYEGPRVTVKGEYLRQYRDRTGKPGDRGWYALGAYRVTEAVQLVGKYEEFERPGISIAQKNTAWTGGANLFLAGPAIKLYLEYISRAIGTPGTRHGLLLTQLQARF